MPQLAYTEIAELVAAGESDAAIATALAARRITVRDTSVPHLRPLLYVEWGLVVVDPITGAKSGPLIDVYDASGTPVELKAGIARLLAHLADPTAEYVRTTRDEFGPLWAGVVDRLNLTAEQLAALEALHGGERYAGVTAEDVAACRAAEAERVARAGLTARLNEAVGAASNALDAGGDETAIRTAWNAAWEGE